MVKIIAAIIILLFLLASLIAWSMCVVCARADRRLEEVLKPRLLASRQGGAR
jgi:hypothetical protein